MQRAREIARLRTTLVGAEQPDDVDVTAVERRSRYRTRSGSRTKSRGTSRETRSQSRNRNYSSTDDEEERPYARSYMRRSRSRPRSSSRGQSRPKSREAGDQKKVKDLGIKGEPGKEDQEGSAGSEELDGSFEECTQDRFCWVCHRIVSETELRCATCERCFHSDCVGRAGDVPHAWSCPECALELASDQAENRSWAMRQISVTQLGTLLKFAVKEMQQRVKSSELFAAPVSLKTHPSYRHFVLRPMDLSLLSSRVDSLSYGSPAGFLADSKYILHNSVVFNGSSSGVTRIARRMLAICASQMDEIETCPECYLRAHTQEDWFTGVCASPHLLVWAKSGRYPFWPAKVVKVQGEEIDCRFFGAHEKALIPCSLVFLFSSHPPTGPLRSSGQLAEALEECHIYISKLQKRHGLFCLAPNRTEFNIDMMDRHLAMQLPKLPASERKNDTTVAMKDVKPASAKPKRSHDGSKEAPKELAEDSEMSDLQRLDALHRDFLEAEPMMVDPDDSSNEDALSWHPTSPLAAKNNAVSNSSSPAVSPLAAKKAPTPAVSPSKLIASRPNSELKGPLSPTVCLTDLRSLTVTPTDHKGGQIRTVDIKTLMPESSATPPSKTPTGQPIMVVNKSTAEPVYTIMSPSSASQPSNRTILVATSNANQYVAVSSSGVGATYTLCKPVSGTTTPTREPVTRQVTMATTSKFISVLPAINKTVASSSPGRPMQVALQSKPVGLTSMQTVKPIAAKPAPSVPIVTTVQTVRLIAASPVATTKPVLVHSVKTLGASSVTSTISTSSLQTVRMIPADSAATRDVLTVTSVPQVKTLPVLSNLGTVSSVSTVKNPSVVTTNTLNTITLTPIQSVKSVGANATAMPSLISFVTKTTVSDSVPVVSARASPSPAHPSDKDDGAGSSMSISTKSAATEVSTSLPTKVLTAVIPKSVESDGVSTNSGAEVLTLVPISPTTGENSKKATGGEIPSEGRMGILTLVPMKPAKPELSIKNDVAEISKKPAAVPMLAARKTIVPSLTREMPEFETVFLREPSETGANARSAVSVYAGRKPVPGSASNGLPKMVYRSSATEPTLKRKLASSTVGEFTILTQAEFDRKHKRRRFEFDPSRPLTLVEHPPPGIKATPLPLSASQATSRASPVAWPLPAPSLVKFGAGQVQASPGPSKASLTARKTISGVGITIATRSKAAAPAAETPEVAPKSFASIQPSPVDKTLAELGAKAFADFYERFLETAAGEGHTEAKVKKKQLELERTRWRLQEQMSEQRSAHLLLLNERAASFRNQLSAQAAEVKRIQKELDDLKKDFKTHMTEVKKKQWCAACLREAKFHCCWNTSYCAKPCQLAHWAKHNIVCKNRQVCRNGRISQPAAAKITQATPKEMVLEEGELDPEAAAARKVALDNAARVIESVANANTNNAGTINFDTESQLSIDFPDQSQNSLDFPGQSITSNDLPNQSLTSTDIPNQLPSFIDFADLPQPTTSVIKESQTPTAERDPAQAEAESDSSEREEPGLYMECIAEGNDSNDGNQSATSSLGSIRVESVRSLGGDLTLWKQQTRE